MTSVPGHGVIDSGCAKGMAGTESFEEHAKFLFDNFQLEPVLATARLEFSGGAACR